MSVTVSGMPQGAWAHNNLLIASREATLPAVCVKCGRPVTGDFFRKKFSWHPQWVYIFVLIALLIYIILALALSKRMSLKVPLCAAHLEKYKTLRVAAAVLLLGAIPEMIVAGTLLADKYIALGIGAGCVAFLAGLVCLVMFNGVLRVKRIDDSYGYFSSASDGFLAQLPRPPAGMVLPR